MSSIDELKGIDFKKSFDEANKKAKKYQSEYNSFVTIIDECEHIESDSLLNGIPYALKDNYSTKGILTTASSNLLKDYVPVYDATVYKKLKESGAVLIGKTVLDEFAMGGTCTTGHTGPTRNPYDKTRQAGGSSGGSAASVALGIVPFAIGSDTGDSVRKPASYCGIVGFKPTYGRISRYGLFAFASSQDTVGVFANNVKDTAMVTDILKGQDDKDLTSLPDEDIKYLDEIDKPLMGKKLFYIKEFFDGEENNQTVKLFFESLEKLKSKGFTIEEESMDKCLLDALHPVYHAVSSAEATSNISNETGIIFGSREEGASADEVMFNTRTKGFSEFIKRRFILGSYVLARENQEKLFLNALRVKRLIVNKMNEFFSKYDGFIMPAAGGVAPLIDNSMEVIDEDKNKNYPLDNHMVIGNFGGYPSITLPMGYVSGLPVGINLTCMIKEDGKTLNIAKHIEDILEVEKKSVGETNV